MPRTFCTIDDLYAFCKTNNFARFSAKENGNRPLILQSVETFEVVDNSKDGLLPVQLKSCHIGVNRNYSSISEDKMRANMGSFKGRPILGSIIKTDTGEYEFHSHDMTINEDGEVEYIEQPIGVISELEEPYLEYDKEEDKTYLMVSGHIFEDYSRAAEILQRRRTCKCSVEIAVEEMSWNAEENYLSIDAFSFRGVTILGYEQDGKTEIEEGMKGSKITIDSFSAEQNSMFNTNYQEKLLETLDKLNATLSNFSINNAKEKGVEDDMNHFEELLEKYAKTVEDITFDYSNMNEEELDAAFEEHFGEIKTFDPDGDEGGDDAGSEGEEGADDGADEGSDEPVEGEEPVVEVPAAEEPIDTPEEEPEADDEPKRKYSIDEEGNVTLQWELSHDDIRSSLYALLIAESDEDYYWPWIVEVYDTYCVYEGDDYKFYKRSYTKDGSNVAFSGEPVEVFQEWLSQEERNALDALKADYALLKEFKESFEANEARAKKEEIFAREEFSGLAENEDFIALKSEMDNFSVEEIEAKVKVIFADHVMKNGQFSMNKNPAKQTMGKIGLVNPNAKQKKKAYGNLFNG